MSMEPGNTVLRHIIIDNMVACEPLRRQVAKLRASRDSDTPWGLSIINQAIETIQYLVRTKCAADIRLALRFLAHTKDWWNLPTIRDVVIARLDRGLPLEYTINEFVDSDRIWVPGYVREEIVINVEYDNFDPKHGNEKCVTHIKLLR